MAELAPETLIVADDNADYWFYRSTNGDTQWYEDQGDTRRGVLIYVGQPADGILDAKVGVSSVPLFENVDQAKGTIDTILLCDLIEHFGGNGVFIVDDSIEFQTLVEFGSSVG